MFRFFAFLLLLMLATNANAADQNTINQLTSVVERLCLSGQQIEIGADIAGNFTIKKLQPGANGDISANIKTTRGGVGYINEEIRKGFDDNTRNCMEPYIDRIFKAILGEAEILNKNDAIVALDWIRPTSTMADAQISLRSRNTSWMVTADGLNYVTYPGLVGQTSMSTAVFFDHNGQAFFARSSIGSSYNQTTSYRGQQNPTGDGPAPNLLCRNTFAEIISYLSSKLGPPYQPPIQTPYNYQDAWNITQGKADYCSRDGSSCSSTASVLKTTAKFHMGDSELVTVSEYTNADSHVDPNYSYGQSPWYDHHLEKCSIRIEARLK